MLVYSFISVYPVTAENVLYSFLFFSHSSNFRFFFSKLTQAPYNATYMHIYLHIHTYVDILTETRKMQHPKFKWMLLKLLTTINNTPCKKNKKEILNKIFLTELPTTCVKEPFVVNVEILKKFIWLESVI